MKKFYLRLESTMLFVKEPVTICNSGLEYTNEIDKAAIVELKDINTIFTQLPVKSTDIECIDVDHINKYKTEPKLRSMPNGFTSWQETHFELCTEINNRLNLSGSKPLHVQETQGHGGLYELAEDLTNEFENKFAGEQWIDKEYWDEIEAFCKLKLDKNGTTS